MELKRRDFLKMTAALAAAGVSPSLLAAGGAQELLNASKQVTDAFKAAK